jgi:hypothetical protein
MKYSTSFRLGGRENVGYGALDENHCVSYKPSSYRISYASHSVPNGKIRVFRRETDQNLNCERYCAQQDIYIYIYIYPSSLAVSKPTCAFKKTQL